MKNRKSIALEGKEIQQELKALRKKIKAETKDLKKRYRAYVKQVDKFCEENWEDTDLCLQAGAPLDQCEHILYYMGGEFEGWDRF